VKKNKYDRNLKILSNQKLTDLIYQLDLKLPDNTIFQPGQFINLNINDNGTPFLNRPFSVYRQSANQISIIYQIIGKGTKILTQFQTGNFIRGVYPLGNAFPEPLQEYEKIILVAGGIGLPPLLFYKNYYQNKKKDMILYYGTKNEKSIIQRNDMEDIPHIIATEEKSIYKQGLVLDFLKDELQDKKNTLILSCGPEKMLEKLYEIILESSNIDCFASFEDYMACGYGVCNGCVRKYMDKQGVTLYKKVCVDGPVFDLKRMIFEPES